jgi:hypothetical protein
VGGEVADHGGGGERAEVAEGRDAGHRDRHWQIAAGAGGADADREKGGQAETEQGKAADRGGGRSQP